MSRKPSVAVRKSLPFWLFAFFLVLSGWLVFRATGEPLAFWGFLIIAGPAVYYAVQTMWEFRVRSYLVEPGPDGTIWPPIILKADRPFRIGIEVRPGADGTISSRPLMLRERDGEE